MRARALMLLCVLALPAGAGENLLRNPGFEETLEPVWHKRTPEDATRKLRRTTDLAHSGTACAALENVQDSYTRLRQGHDHAISVPSGSMVELSAWVRSELSGDGVVVIQLYCMDAKDGIRSQPTSGHIPAKGKWTRGRVLAVVPEGTAYCMAYLQIKGGTGKVYYDDVELRVVRQPRKPEPAPKIAVLTDLPDDDATLKELKTLLGDGFVRITEKNPADQMEQCGGAVVLLRDRKMTKPESDALDAFARNGRGAFMDIRNYAQRLGIEPVAVEVAKGKSLQERMASGLRIRKARWNGVPGFAAGQIMPRCGADGKTLVCLPKHKLLDDEHVLAVGPGGEAGHVQEPREGDGWFLTADILSLGEPHFANVGAYYKYRPLCDALARPVVFGEYYPRKLTYAEFVERMRKTAKEFPQIRFQDEGPACGDYRIYSLNLGREGAPLYFLYAAAHGSEWEPGYGLLTFARRIAQGRLKDVIDLGKVSIKIVPCLNPSGYDARRRHNANGVDLNRQGDYCWERFKGRDSSKDGQWGPQDYDWKGSGPFVEPEAKTYQKIIQAKNLHCLLDFHGNCSARANKVAILPATARDDNELRAFEMQHIANRRLRGRHLLRQSDEDAPSQYLITRVHRGGAVPYLMNTGARGRYGVLVELTAGYGETYGTVLQTDVTCEVCRALFAAYPPPEPAGGQR